MYDLHVYHAGERSPTKVLKAQTATDAINQIPELLAKYDTCERVAVLSAGLFLFSVDHHGNRQDREEL